MYKNLSQSIYFLKVVKQQNNPGRELKLQPRFQWFLFEEKNRLKRVSPKYSIKLHPLFTKPGQLLLNITLIVI
jgi:hypothetical protein